MSREPTRLADIREAPSPEAEFMGGLIRAQRRARAPEPKMQELAARLGPILQEKSPSTFHVLPWLGMTVAAIVVAGGAWVMRANDEPAAPVVASVAAEAPPEESAPAPPTAAIEAPAAIPVDALPNANVRQSPATPAPRCDEIELVDRADVALRSGDPRRALLVVRDLEQRCPAGALVQERERIAIEALAKVGRVDAAKARARAFEERFPSSPHLRRVRQVVERLASTSR